MLRPGVRALGAYLAVQHHLPVERATQVLDGALGAGCSVRELLARAHGHVWQARHEQLVAVLGPFTDASPDPDPFADAG